MILDLALLSQWNNHLGTSQLFLSESNLIRTHNQLVRNRTLNHLASLAKWLMLVYKVSGCGFESHCCHLKTLDMMPASSKEFPDIQANSRVWTHSETRMWHDNNRQTSKMPLLHNWLFSLCFLNVVEKITCSTNDILTYWLNYRKILAFLRIFRFGHYHKYQTPLWISEKQNFFLWYFSQFISLIYITVDV